MQFAHCLKTEFQQIQQYQTQETDPTKSHELKIYQTGHSQPRFAFNISKCRDGSLSVPLYMYFYFTLYTVQCTCTCICHVIVKSLFAPWVYLLFYRVIYTCIIQVYSLKLNLRVSKFLFSKRIIYIDHLSMCRCTDSKKH